jgi:hypothetical protein
MATPPKAYGIPYQFNADRFRNAIRFVFEMEQPPEFARRITFHFEDVITYTGRQDGERVPFDPTQSVVRTTPTPITVPCDVQFKNQSDEPTAFGTVVPAKVTVLLLDVDYVKVKDASYVHINGDKYLRHFEEPAFGLFDVGLHTMVFVAENEL